MRGKKEQGKVIVDLDAVFDFVFSQEERDVDINLEETYGVDEETKESKLLTKVKRENKSSDHTQHEAIRYEFIRNLLSTFDDIEFDEDTHQPFLVTLSQEIAWNTLFTYGFLKKV